MLTKNNILTMMVFIVGSCSVHANENVVLQKYTYGYPYSSEGRRNKPVIDPLPKAGLTHDGKVNVIYPYYSIDEQQSNLEQYKHHLHVHLSLRIIKQHVVATVNFQNRSGQAYFVHKSRLAIEDPDFYPLYGPAFSIATEGVSSFYLGNRWHFDDEVNDSKVAWQELPDNKNYSFTVKLNDAYAFLSKKHDYSIGTLEYSIVNAQWFVEKRIYKALVSILEWKYLTCQIRENSNYIFRINKLCLVGYSNEIPISDFLYELDLQGFNSDNYFEIRTNQVKIKIDGDKLTSPYSIK